MNELKGNLGMNGHLYREIYRRAQILAKKSGMPRYGGLMLRVGCFEIDVETETRALRIYRLSPDHAPSLVLAADRWGTVRGFRLADGVRLKEAVEALRYCMILDDLVDA